MLMKVRLKNEIAEVLSFHSKFVGCEELSWLNIVAELWINEEARRTLPVPVSWMLVVIR